MMQLHLQRAIATHGGSAAARHVPGIAARVPITQRRGSSQRLKAALEPEVAAAVGQQALAYAVVLAAEAVYTRSYIPEGDKGRPEIVPVAAGAATTLAAVAMLNLGGSGPVSSVGLVVGLLSSTAMIYYCAQRTANLQFQDADWPGPKAWPVTMALISFFAWCAFLQALVADFSTPVAL